MGSIAAHFSFEVEDVLKYLSDNDMDDYMLFIPKNKKQVDETITIILSHINGEAKT